MRLAELHRLKMSSGFAQQYDQTAQHIQRSLTEYLENSGKFNAATPRVIKVTLKNFYSRKTVH